MKQGLGQLIVFIGALLMPLGATMSQNSPAARLSNMQVTTEAQVRDVLQPLLNRYCGESCRMIDVKVVVDEQIPEGGDMGFESAVSSGPKKYFVKKIDVDLQIDGRVNSINRDRLEKIIEVNLRPFGLLSQVHWSSVAVPRIGTIEGSPDQLRLNLERKLSREINQVISRYCPSSCIVENISIEGLAVSIDEAESLLPNQMVRDIKNGGVFKIESINIDIVFDSVISEKEQAQILQVLKSRTRFADPVNFNVSAREFPETYESKQEKERQAADDPYGLEKLRRMLILFRDLAGTKEIISNSTQSSQATMESDQTLSEASRTAMGESLSTTEMIIIGVVGLLVLLIVVFGVYKITQANRTANAMVGSGQSAEENYAEGTGTGSPDGRDLSSSLRFQLKDLKTELLNLFMEHPKVAKETFSRLLREDGVESVSNYVHIFGHLVIFELLDDPNLQRDLYELSEYYHNSDITVSEEDQVLLLQKLKTKCTASEIRVLTRKASEKFDFLNKLDPAQVYKLVQEESVQVQSIVLTQLERKRRRAVFDMYQGQHKVDLLQQLSMAEAIPKEFLFNVAKALNRKISTRPEFDTENLRSSDILIDLLEKATLIEQRQLMQQLTNSNPDTARSVKMNLVTVEIMPYLKDGHLLELILGLERDGLLAFLMGTREHIRDLLLRKAPEELADSWIEDMESMASVDEANYRIAEMKVLARVKSLANNGVINLLEINDMIFDESAGAGIESGNMGETAPPLNRVSIPAA